MIGCSERDKLMTYRCHGGLVSFFFFFGSSSCAALSVLNHLFFQHPVVWSMFYIQYERRGRQSQQ